jgi:hypothetical protein
MKAVGGHRSNSEDARETREIWITDDDHREDDGIEQAFNAESFIQEFNLNRASESEELEENEEEPNISLEEGSHFDSIEKSPSLEARLRLVDWYATKSEAVEDLKKHLETVSELKPT